MDDLDVNPEQSSENALEGLEERASRFLSNKEESTSDVDPVYFAGDTQFDESDTFTIIHTKEPARTLRKPASVLNATEDSNESSETFDQTEVLENNEPPFNSNEPDPRFSDQNLLEQIQILKKHLAQSEKNAQELNDRIEELETEKELAEEEKLALEEDKLAIEAKFERQVRDLQSQLEESRKKMKFQSKESEERLQSFKGKTKMLEEENVLLQEEKELVEEEKRELTKQVEELSGKVTNLEGKNIALKHKVERLETINSRLEAEILTKKEESEKKIDSLSEEVGKLEEQLAIIRRQGQEWIEEYQREEKRHGPRLRELGEQIRNLEKQNRWLENQRNEYASRRDQLTLERERLSAQVEDLTKSLELKKKEASSLRDRHESEKAGLTQQKTRMTDEIKKIKEEIDKIGKETDELIDTRDQLEKQWEAADTEAQELLKKIDELEESKRDSKEKIKKLQNDIKGLNQKSVLLIPNTQSPFENMRDFPQGHDQLKSEYERLRGENAQLKIELDKVYAEKQNLDDEKQRLEIHMTEMVDTVENASLEIEGVKRLENEVIALRTERGSLVARLATQEIQISFVNNLRLALENAKKQLLSRENEIMELRSKLELNELNIKSKILTIEQLQMEKSQDSSKAPQNILDISKSTITEDTSTIDYKQLMDELYDKLDQANVEIGKLRYQLTEAAQKAQDDLKDVKIQELEYQKAELEKVLREREEEIVKEQSKSKFYSMNSIEGTRGEIIEGISELMSNSQISISKSADISFSHELSWVNSAGYSVFRSTPARNNVKVKSLQPDFQALKSQLNDLNRQLDSKNLDLEKAIATGQNLSRSLEEAHENIRLMEELVRNAEKSMAAIREELTREQQHAEALEQQLRDQKCSRCGALSKSEGLQRVPPTTAQSNQSMTIEKEIEATLQQNLQTVDYLERIIHVVSQQNKLINSNVGPKDDTKGIQNLLEGLSQQTSQMQKTMEENGVVLKRLASTALTESPSKKQRRQSSKLSNTSHNLPKQVDDTLEIKREDLEAIVRASSDMYKHPAQLLSQIDSLAASMLDREIYATENKNLSQLFDKLVPNLESYAKKFESIAASLQNVLKEPKKDDADQIDGSNMLLADIHELMANITYLTTQIKKCTASLSTSTKETISSTNDGASITSSQDDRNKKAIERLRNLVANQTRLIADYEATIEVFIKSSQEAETSRAAIASITHVEDINSDADRDQHVLKSKLKELHSVWQQEVETNAALRIVMKEMKVSASRKEEEMRQEIENLAAQMNGSLEKLRVFKLQTEKLEQKYRQAEERLKRKTESEKALHLKFDNVIKEHARELESLRHRWGKERALLTENVSKAKTQQLQKEMEVTLHQEKEALNKKVKLQKDSYEKEAKSLQKDNEKLNAKIRDLEIEIQSATASKKILTLEKASLTKEKTELQQQVDNYIKEAERYRKKNSSVTELESRLRRLQKEKDVTSERTAQKIADLQKELQTTMEKVTKLTKEKSTALKEKSELQRKYLLASEVKESLESDVRADKQHMKALEVEIQNLTDQLQSERRDHQSKNEQLSRYEDELQAVQEQCNRLREEVEQLQDTLAHEQIQHKVAYESILKQQREELGEREVKRLNHELSLVNDRVNEIKDSARNEIDALEKEIHSTRQQLALLEGEKNDVNKQNFQAELNKERKRHLEERNLLLKEIRYHKTRFNREAGFRADLSYQKKFILLLLGGLESCEHATSLLIASLDTFPRLEQPSPLLIKFRGVAAAIIAIQRMRILKNSWERARETKRLIQQQLQNRQQ